MVNRLLCLLSLCCAVALSGRACADTITIRYQANKSEAPLNPYCGLVAWANNDSPREQPFSLVYANLTWSDFEPEEGLYDFASFEEENHLEKWRTEGKKLILRFVLDLPDSKQHMDIPQWLYEQTQDGTAYKTSYGRGYSPNYENPVLIAAHARAIQALAARYGDDDFLAYIQLGSIGHWGEWHIHDSLGQLPSMEVLEAYVRPYLGAFPHAFLLARRPFGFAAANGMGLYNDGSGLPDATETWLGWIKNGGSYQGVENALTPMADAWLTAPVGGEIGSGVTADELLGDDFEQTLSLFSASHTSWIGPHSFTDEVEAGGELQASLDSLLAHIGYRLRVDEAALTTDENGRRSLTLRWLNDGIAPFYFDEWVACIRCVFDNGEERIVLPITLSQLTPEKPTNVTVSLPGGAYRVMVGIVDPSSGEAGVWLAMESLRDGLWVELMKVE